MSNFLFNFDFVIVSTYAGNKARTCFYYSTRLPYNDLNGCKDKTDTVELCQDLCQKTKGCFQFTWFDKPNKSDRKCCMKNVHRNNFVYEEGYISGPKYCGKFEFRVK